MLYCSQRNPSHLRTNPPAVLVRYSAVASRRLQLQLLQQRLPLSSGDQVSPSLRHQPRRGRYLQAICVLHEPGDGQE
jgi:hypothetical protein